MTRIVRKLVTNARYAGHWIISADASEWPDSSSLGTFKSSTSSVMAMANTPSLNASMRAVSDAAMAGCSHILQIRASRRLLASRGGVGEGSPHANQRRALNFGLLILALPATVNGRPRSA